jgi:hypothetical protein
MTKPNHRFTVPTVQADVGAQYVCALGWAWGAIMWHTAQGSINFGSVHEKWICHFLSSFFCFSDGFSVFWGEKLLLVKLFISGFLFIMKNEKKRSLVTDVWERNGLFSTTALPPWSRADCQCQLRARLPTEPCAQLLTEPRLRFLCNSARPVLSEPLPVLSVSRVPASEGRRSSLQPSLVCSRLSQF